MFLPDCAVCETGYAPSLAHTCTRCSSTRREGSIASTVIAALVTVSATVTIFQYMLSIQHEEGIVGCFYRWVLRAVPLQAFKIIAVVWQILTQVCAHQADFLWKIQPHSNHSNKNSVFSGQKKIR